MPAKPWYPFYWSDYRNRTGGLTPQQHGIYILLLAEYYITGKPLPADEKQLLLICFAFASDLVTDLHYVLHKFFVQRGEHWHHERVDEELEKSRRISALRSRSGRRGGRPKIVQSGQKQLLSQSQSQSSTTSTTANAAVDVGQKSPAGEVSDRCPYSEIIAAYHETLPDNPEYRKRTNARDGRMRARWRNGLPSVEHWRKYFRYVGQSRFLTGQVPGTNDRAPFVANLDWLCHEKNYVEILEGKYHR